MQKRRDIGLAPLDAAAAAATSDHMRPLGDALGASVAGAQAAPQQLTDAELGLDISEAWALAVTWSTKKDFKYLFARLAVYTTELSRLQAQRRRYILVKRAQGDNRDEAALALDFPKYSTVVRCTDRIAALLVRMAKRFEDLVGQSHAADAAALKAGVEMHVRALSELAEAYYSLDVAGADRVEARLRNELGPALIALVSVVVPSKTTSADRERLGAAYGLMIGDYVGLVHHWHAHYVLRTQPFSSKHPARYLYQAEAFGKLYDEAL